MGEAVIQRTFAGGELAPALHARADQVKYVTGLRTCHNFLLLRSGGAANRPGTRLVAECKTNSIAVKLLRYASEIAGESILIECGVNYFRFFKNGAAVELTGVSAYNGATSYVIGDIVESGGDNYYCIADTVGVAPPNASYWYEMPGDLLEIPHPFGTSLCNASQSGNVITLTSGAGVVAPHELIYVSLTHWIIRIVTTEPSIAAPAGVTATAGVSGTMTRAYQVTAGASESYEESLSSGVASLPTCGQPTPENPHVISWTAVAGAAEYYVYCDPYGNGTFGFLGTATGLNTFNDVGFAPDFSITPPQARTPFSGAGNYPRQSATYQQRRFFANTLNDPAAIYGSRVGFISNFNISSPLQDDDALTFKVAGNHHNPIRHLVGLKTLIALTDAGEWAIGTPGVALSPSTLGADQPTYVGAAPDLPPVVIGNAIIYVQARGTIIRDLRWDENVDGYAGRDLTVFATHLFDGYTVLDLDFQQTPNSTVWVARSDGTLLGLTYLRDQEVWGWHRHSTGAAGRFEHVCVVPETNEDTLYVLTRRTIGGAYHRFIERLEQRDIVSYDADSFFVDCGLSYSGAAALTFSGLSHLAGQPVAVLADGEVLYNGHEAAGEQLIVTAGGSVTLPPPATGTGYSTVHIGLAIPYADLETLDLDVEGSNIRDKRKKVTNLALLLNVSTPLFYIGPDADNLVPYKPEPFEGTADTRTGRAEAAIINSFNDNGRILVRQKDPVPLTVLGILPNPTIGG